MKLLAPAVLGCLLVGCVSDNGDPAENVRSTVQPLVTEVCGQPMNGPVQGIDISEWQGKNFDWAGVKAKRNLSFGYARVSYGANHLDLTFAANWAAIKAAGLLRGTYQYFLPKESVTTQAQIVIDAVGKLGDGDLPVQFDVEPTADERSGLTSQQIVDKMKQWLDLVEAGTGKRPFIYTNAYLWQDAINSTEFGKYPLWMSNYLPPSGCPKINEGWTNWTIWQYSDTNATLDVNVFNGTLAQLQAFAGSGGDTSDPYPSLTRRSTADIDGDGQTDVCARAIKGVLCRLSKGDGFQAEWAGPAWSDEDGWLNAAYRETIQFGDIDGDGKADICARGPEGIVCNKSDGKSFPTEVKGPAWSDKNGWSDPSRVATVQLADVNGDGKQDVCGRSDKGFSCFLSDGNGFPTEIQGPAWSDADKWSRADQYATIQLADIDGDGKADACAREASGVVCYRSDGNGFPTKVVGPEWSNAKSWNRVQYGSTIRFVDVDGDGRADVCGRGPAGIVCAVSQGDAFGAEITGPAWSDTDGWDKAGAYRTIVWGDIDGDHKIDVCARRTEGMECHLGKGDGFGDKLTGPAFDNERGWTAENQYITIAFGDINHDGKEDLCGRGEEGLLCAVSSGQAFGTPNLVTDWADETGWNKNGYYNSIRLVGAPPPVKYVGPPVGSTTDSDGGTNDGEPPTTDKGAPASTSDGCSVGRPASSTSTAPYAVLLALGLVLGRRKQRSSS